MTQVVDRPAVPRNPAEPTGTGENPPRPKRSPPPETSDPGVNLTRPALAVAFAMLAVAVMTGGTFDGWSPRLFAAVGGVGGVGLALFTARSKRPWLAQTVSMVVIAGLGLLATLTAGVDSLGHLQDTLSRAASEGRTLPTPLAFTPAWRLLVVVVAAAVGYGAAWLATDLRRPRLGLLVPLPLLVFTAISQPAGVQAPDAIAAFALYALGIAILYRDTGPDSGLRLSRSFELKRTLRAAAVVVVVVVALVGLDRADVLFPSPAYDPARSSQLPRAVPAAQNVDRVLFSVRAPNTGPWRTGVLSIYDGSDWRIPPVAGGDVSQPAAGGEVDAHIVGTLRSSFTVAGLDGPTLPTPARASRIARSSSEVVYDRASGLVRLGPGVLPMGLTYEVSSAPVPTPNELRGAVVDANDTADIAAPPMPSEVGRLLQGAPAAGWARADYVRLLLLNRVVVSGTGEPVSVPPSKVVDMLLGTRKGTPYELVAAEALLERWAGIPARMGYGFEGGDKRGDGAVDVHPKHASTWLEVSFRGLGWFPVTGGPLRATPTLGDQSASSASQEVIPGPDVAVNLFVPLDVITPAPAYEEIRLAVLAVILALLIGATAYILWPVGRKAYRRSRRRAWARRSGSAARVAVAYAEFRELGIDLGDEHHSDTPLLYLDRVAPDLEHTEFAWLVTRVLWGDVVAGPDEVNAAESMSRSLRGRLARGQPATMRVIAAVSRHSLRNPYWDNLQREAINEAA